MPHPPRFIASIFLRLAMWLAFLLPLQGKTRPHYTFVLPDGYIGWVQIIFNDPQAPRLPIQKNGGRLIDVPESGIVRTSDFLVLDTGKDEFYYRVVLPNEKLELHAIPPEHVLPGAHHGGFDVMDTGGKGKGYSWFVFFGPPEIRAHTPLADITKEPGYGRKMVAPDVYPTLGRLPSTPAVKP